MHFGNHADLPHFSHGPRDPRFLKPGFPSARFLAKMACPASCRFPIVSDPMVDPHQTDKMASTLLPRRARRGSSPSAPLSPKAPNQTLSSIGRFTKNFSSGPDFVDQTHGLSGKEAHRLNISSCVNVRRHTGEPLNRYLGTTNERATDDGFVRPGILGLTLAGNPLPDERSSQRSVGAWGHPYPKRIVCTVSSSLAATSPALKIGRAFASGVARTRPHYDAVSTQAECSRESSCIGDPSCGQGQVRV